MKNQITEDLEIEELGILPDEEDLDDNAYQFQIEDLPHLNLPESPIQYIIQKEKKLKNYATKYSQEDLEILPDEEDFDFIELPKIYFPKLEKKKSLNEMKIIKEEFDFTELGILPDNSLDSNFQFSFEKFSEWKYFTKKNSFSFSEEKLIRKSIFTIDANSFEILEKQNIKSLPPNLQLKNEDLKFIKNGISYKINHQFFKNIHISFLEEYLPNGKKLHFIPKLNEIGCFIHPDSFTVIDDVVYFLVFHLKKDFNGFIDLMEMRI
eukprot:gene6451-10458_t